MLWTEGVYSVEKESGKEIKLRDRFGLTPLAVPQNLGVIKMIKCETNDPRSGYLPVNKNKNTPVLDGYFIHWCMTHKQPLAWCDKDELQARVMGMDKQIMALRAVLKNIHSKFQHEFIKDEMNCGICKVLRG